MNTKWKKICITSTLLLAQVVAVSPTNIMAASTTSTGARVVSFNVPKFSRGGAGVASSIKFASRNGWQNVGGNWILLKNGVRQTGLVEYNGQTYYLNSNGVMQTGMIQIGEACYYFGSNGALLGSSGHS